MTEKITIEPCCCGYPTCKDYWLVGVGKFVQGSGFDKEEAQHIADLLNDSDERLRTMQGRIEMRVESIRSELREIDDALGAPA